MISEKRNIEKERRKFINEFQTSKNKKDFIGLNIITYNRLFGGIEDPLDLFGRIVWTSTGNNAITTSLTSSAGQWNTFTFALTPNPITFSGYRVFQFWFQKGPAFTGVTGDFHGISLSNTTSGTTASPGFPFGITILGWLFSGESNNCSLYDCVNGGPTYNTNGIGSTAVFEVIFSYDGNKKFGTIIRNTVAPFQTYVQYMTTLTVPGQLNVNFHRFQVGANVNNPTYTTTLMRATGYSSIVSQ